MAIPAITVPTNPLSKIKISAKASAPNRSPKAENEALGLVKYSKKRTLSTIIMTMIG